MNTYDFRGKLPFSTDRLPKKVIFSYAVDYVIIILLFIIFWAIDAVEPYHQHFSLQNYTLQYPYATSERVSVGLLFFLVVILPIGVIAVYTLVLDGIFSHKGSRGGYSFKDRLWELNCGVLGLLLASGTAFVITGALKNATGKPRPDLIDRCRPPPGTQDPLLFGLSNSTICTQTNFLKDGFRSFPSGHSSSAFGGLFYLSLYLAGKLHVLDNRGEVWKTYVVLVPTLAAALIAISRIMDARHHPFDVISGSLLGVLTAFAAYRQYFPPVSESWRKGRAYPIRSWGSEPLGPETKHQEREMARDQGVEPLRTAAAREDEEHLADVYAGAQIPASEQNAVNQQQHPAYRHAGPSLASQPRSYPATASTSQRGHAEGNWSSSASDHEGDDEGYEMQPRYALNDSNSAGVQHDAYPSSSISGLNAPTAYNGARTATGPPQIPPISMYSTHSGDLGVTHERARASSFSSIDLRPLASLPLKAQIFSCHIPTAAPPSHTTNDDPQRPRRSPIPRWQVLPPLILILALVSLPPPLPDPRLAQTSISLAPPLNSILLLTPPPPGTPLRIGILHARWNSTIIAPLLAGARRALLAAHVHPSNIVIQSVPGSYELPYAVQRMYAASQVQASTSGSAGGLGPGAVGDLLSASLGDLVSAGNENEAEAGGTRGKEQDKEEGEGEGEGEGASRAPFDAIIAIGVLIKGETMHFEYIADAVTHGLMRVQLDAGVPVVFGLLTVLDEEQAKVRAGMVEGKHNHGEDWGNAAVELGVKRRAWGAGKLL